MDTYADILADTERYRAEAIAMLAAVEAGARLSEGVSKDDAVRILTENIATYESVLRRFGRL